MIYMVLGFPGRGMSYEVKRLNQSPQAHLREVFRSVSFTEGTFSSSRATSQVKQTVFEGVMLWNRKLESSMNTMCISGLMERGVMRLRQHSFHTCPMTTN
jgi:hypothetical protein